LKAKRGGLKAEIADRSSQGRITLTLMEESDGVRIAGDDAAHPEALGKVTRDEAEASLEFTDAFLNRASLPAKRDARKAARKP
jgi:Domain of unknown function (DUF4145)